ncbi:MAG TPA: hypothetical protein VFR90_12465 [Methylibium sp.]|uniref:hypothetical protein n=1 Tax=Methylibium sp. TaxID=2067992 RepID=UPI002DB8ED14|nr:hypothetical protein [Methylibium sp.]HEU4459927.1 hypothetical protein [Methylibium sp.]
MFHVPMRRLLPVPLAVIGMAAAAQAPAPIKADPLDASASTPAVTYRSSLTGYQRHAEQPVGSWRQANETVNRGGGWRAYAREAAQPDAPAPSAPSAPSAPGGHGGHKN